MKARVAKKEEYRRIDELFSVSFSIPLNEEETSQPTTSDDVRYVAVEDDKIVSAIYRPSYTFSFDKNNTKCIGIGGVSTLPEYRNKGAIRAIFDVLLEDAYHAGYDFSYLYPFSTAYYRKFGYECACEETEYCIFTEALPKKPTTGCFLLDKATSLQAKNTIKKCEQFLYENYNGYIKANGEDFEWVLKADPYKSSVFTYVFDDGENYGFVTYKTSKDSSGLFIDVEKAAYNSVEALTVLLAVIRTYGADYKRVKITLPTSEKIENLINEWSFGYLERRTVSHGMVRVLNAENVLKQASYLDSGKINIQIIDEQIKENNTVFRVTFNKGKCTKIEHSDSFTPDVSMPVNLFSACIFGTKDYEDCRYNVDFKCTCDKILFEKIFYKKKNYICTDF